MSRLPSGLRLRDARIEDAEAIHALYHAAYDPANDPHRPPHVALRDTVEDVRAALRDARVLVAEDETGRIVASVALRRIADVRRLAVDPARQGEGLGAALLEAAVDAAREAGFEVAMLDTLPDHPWLGAFYARHGFEDRCTEQRPDGTRWRQMRRRLR